MNPLIRSFLFGAVVLMAPIAYSADTSLPASLLAGVSDADLSAGLKSGLGSALESAMSKLTQPGALKVSPPPALAKIEAAAESAGQAGATGDLSSSVSAAVAKIAPQAADLMKSAFKDVKITDAKAALLNAPGGGTQYFRKVMTPALHDKLLPLVKEAVASAGVTDKAKSLLASAGSLASLAGGKSLADIDTYVCDQVINKSFQLMAKEEAAIRANPSLLTNPLAEKVFSLIKK